MADLVPLSRSVYALALIAAGACASHEPTSRAVVSPTTPSHTIAAVLEGRAPGVTVVPSAGVRIVSRPVDPDRSGRKPLYVVDGVPVAEAEMLTMELTVAQIVDIRVMKSDIATRTYGDRARDGALLITTRRL